MATKYFYIQVLAIKVFSLSLEDEVRGLGASRFWPHFGLGPEVRGIFLALKIKSLASPWSHRVGHRLGVDDLPCEMTPSLQGKLHGTKFLDQSLVR